MCLNVKAEGYSMDCTLLCEDSVGNRVELTPHGLNQINFGEVGFCWICDMLYGQTSKIGTPFFLNTP